MCLREEAGKGGAGHAGETWHWVLCLKGFVTVGILGDVSGEDLKTIHQLSRSVLSGLGSLLIGQR